MISCGKVINLKLSKRCLSVDIKFGRGSELLSVGVKIPGNMLGNRFRVEIFKGSTLCDDEREFSVSYVIEERLKGN